MTTNNNHSTKNNDTLFSEAPASWNTRYAARLRPDQPGRGCKRTLERNRRQSWREKPTPWPDPEINLRRNPRR